MDEQNVSETTAQSIPQRNNSLGIPVAIVISAALIAGAIYFSGTKVVPPQQANTAGTLEEQVTPEVEVAPVTEADHIRGNPNAPIMFVEYSDYDCPYCKLFHETMNRIMAEYGSSGEVAWVYRHFPIESLHEDAPKIAEAAECVAELAGNEAFWKFSDLVFGERAVNERTDITRLPEFARTAGVTNIPAFESCLENGTYTDAIATDISEAIAAGGTGTPHSIVFVTNERVGEIKGAQSYADVKKNVDTILKELSGKEDAE